MVPESGVYKVVWPRGNRVVEGIPFTQRPDTLEGKTICELWNGVYRGDEIFPIVEKELVNRYPGIKFVSYEVFGSTHGGEEAKVIAALPAKLEQSRGDAVISGMGC